MIFLAGFVDSIAGGGGLVSLPTYYMVGLPPHLALGTNKFSSSIGTAASTVEYLRGGHIYKKLIAVSVIGALTGSTVGAQCALFLDESVLRVIMLVLLPVLAVFTIIKKDLLEPKEQQQHLKWEQIIALVMSLVVGWYDGFFGPGTGTFLMLGFVGLLHLNPITACGNTKVVNLCSNIAALLTFVLNGAIFYNLAIPCAVFSILGHYIGARTNIKNGAKLIKPVLLLVIVLLMLTIGRDVFIAKTA